MNAYDIVVIGSGPAGCMAAWLLAPHCKVLLVERKKLPRDKSCSGVLVRKSVEMLEARFGRIPDAVKCQPAITRGLIVQTGTNRVYDFEDPGLNIVRKHFDHWLALEARQAGAVIADETLVVALDDQGGTSGVSLLRKGHRERIEAKLVVACDGVFGASRRLTGAPPLRRMLTLQKHFRGRCPLDPAKFYAFTSPRYSGYDAWVNTKNERVIIGTAAGTLGRARSDYDSFRAYLTGERGFHLEEELSEEIWAIPAVLPKCELLYRRGRVFFAGEAAGFLNPFGEGISLALESSTCLAAAVLQHWGTGDLDRIERDYLAESASVAAYMRSQWDLIRQLAPEFWTNAQRGINPGA